MGRAAFFVQCLCSPAEGSVALRIAKSDCRADYLKHSAALPKKKKKKPQKVVGFIKLNGTDVFNGTSSAIRRESDLYWTVTCVPNFMARVHNQNK